MKTRTRGGGELEERLPSSAVVRALLDRHTHSLLLALFLLAFGLRLSCALQYRAAPDFSDPIGDSALFLERARDILAGDLAGGKVPFHSSPLYPYLIALAFLVSGDGFLAVRTVQCVLGAANCVLVALLARRLARGDPLVMTLAGTCAALYGLLAFFDIDLLAISLTLFCVDAGLLLLLRSQASGRAWTALAAGVALGVAASDKVNLLAFLPFAAWYLAGELRVRPPSWRPRPALWLVVGAAFVILPITARNVLVGKDLVLVSSNGGVNLFIGNNPEARGVFSLPPSSGLRNSDLESSSVQVAEAALGRALRPSEVSRFWALRAWSFVAGNPLAEGKLLLRKLTLLAGRFEIPNHLNFYYMRQEHLSRLKLLFVGWWLVAPLALVGMAWRLRRGLTLPDRLLLAFLLACAGSLLPFFITERYRLPLVPALIALAAATAVEIGELAGAGRWRALLPLALGLGAATAVVWLPPPLMDYSFSRTTMAVKYLERASRNPDRGAPSAATAIVELKRALETEPLSVDAHYNLGRAYEMVGFHSGAARELEQAAALDPSHRHATGALAGVRAKLAAHGDLVSATSIPLTPYEEARTALTRGEPEQASGLLRRVLHDDPYHWQAANDLGLIELSNGHHARAIAAFKRALRCRPDTLALLNNLAGAYYRAGKLEQARRTWRLCLELDPESDLVRRQLALVEHAP